MDLELTVNEHPIGDFHLDLLGHDVSTGETVIVENQAASRRASQLPSHRTPADVYMPFRFVDAGSPVLDAPRAAAALRIRGELQLPDVVRVVHSLPDLAQVAHVYKR